MIQLVDFFIELINLAQIWSISSYSHVQDFMQQLGLAGMITSELKWGQLYQISTEYSTVGLHSIHNPIIGGGKAAARCFIRIKQLATLVVT